jgi:hypothetical protein
MRYHTPCPSLRAFFPARAVPLLEGLDPRAADSMHITPSIALRNSSGNGSLLQFNAFSRRYRSEWVTSTCDSYHLFLPPFTLRF